MLVYSPIPTGKDFASLGIQTSRSDESPSRPRIPVHVSVSVSVYVCMLTIDLPLSHFTVIGIFGPSVSFTGPLTRQAFARLATRPMDPPATVSTSTSEHALSGGGWPGDGWGWGKCSVWDEVEGERSGGGGMRRWWRL